MCEPVTMGKLLTYHIHSSFILVDLFTMTLFGQNKKGLVEGILYKILIHLLSLLKFQLNNTIGTCLRGLYKYTQAWFNLGRIEK